MAFVITALVDLLELRVLKSLDSTSYILPTCSFDRKIMEAALAGVAQWIERWLVKQRVTSLIPSQGTCLGWGPGPQLGSLVEVTTH